MFVLWYTYFNGGETNEHVSLELQNSWLVEGDEMNTRAPRFPNNPFLFIDLYFDFEVQNFDRTKRYDQWMWTLIDGKA